MSAPPTANTRFWCLVAQDFTRDSDAGVDGDLFSRGTRKSGGSYPSIRFPNPSCGRVSISLIEAQLENVIGFD
jgi:hypothetical protein